MGRGGGGGGGGSHSFGGSSGRSFGGSSSHSSRGGSSHRSSRSSYRSSYSSGPHISTHRHYHYGPSYGYGGTYSPGGLISGIITSLVVIMVLVILFIALTSASSISRSTVEREPLKPYAAFDKSCIDDDAGWIHDRNTLLQGMESFYKETGVQPALAIYEEINGERYLSDDEIEDFMTDEYDELIGHERGVLMLFCEYADSDWYVYYMAGEDAQTVMDSEACGILVDYVHDLYTNDNYSDEEFFAAVFEKTGNRIMTVTPTVASKIPLIVGCVIVIAVILGILKAIKEKNRREAEKAKETERILNSPIDRI